MGAETAVLLLVLASAGLLAAAVVLLRAAHEVRRREVHVVIHHVGEMDPPHTPGEMHGPKEEGKKRWLN